MATTIEQFLQRNAKFNVNKTTHWKTDELDIIVNKLPAGKLMELRESGMSDFETAKEVIYLSCPIFRDLANTDQLHHPEPHDVIEDVLTLNEIQELFTYCVAQISTGVDDVKKQ